MMDSEKSLEEALAKVGIHMLGISELSWLAKIRVKRIVNGSPFVALYTGKDAELMN